MRIADGFRRNGAAANGPTRILKVLSTAETPTIKIVEQGPIFQQHRAAGPDADQIPECL